MHGGISQSEDRSIFLEWSERTSFLTTSFIEDTRDRTLIDFRSGASAATPLSQAALCGIANFDTESEEQNIRHSYQSTNISISKQTLPSTWPLLGKGRLESTTTYLDFQVASIVIFISIIVLHDAVSHSSSARGPRCASR